MTLVGSGTHLTYAQLEAYWIQAGGSSATAPIAAAIALAESGGWTNNINENDTGGTGSYGLWQINNGGRFSNVGPNYGGPAGWNNPATNAQLAVAKYKGAGGSWLPWGTYTNGSYRQYVQGGVPAATTGINATTTAAGIGAGAANAATGSGSGGSGSPWYDDLLGILGGIATPGYDPIGLLISGISKGFATGLETGFMQVFRNLWDPVTKRIFWSLEVVFGIVLVVIGISGIVFVGLAKGITDNPQTVAALAAAPETGGLSLLLGAAGARSHGRERRQIAGGERDERRIAVAERRVAVQESSEQRRVANAAAATAQASGGGGSATLDASISRARSRARQKAEAKRIREARKEVEEVEE